MTNRQLIEEIRDYLRETLPESRYRHVIGTWNTAVKLAQRHGADETQAALAALLHDTARGYSDEQLVAYVKEHGLRVPEFETVAERSPALLHGFVSADIARNRFGVRSRCILQAIAFHTFGRHGMNRLDKIIYVADSTSPDRRYPNVEAIRRHSMHDLDRAVLLALENTLKHIVAERRWIHPYTIRAWNDLLRHDPKREHSCVD